MGWDNVTDQLSVAYLCGYCGNQVAANHGWLGSEGYIRICPHCGQPTYFTGGRQIPGARVGADVAALPADVDALYQEARDAVAANAFTASVMVARKLLMHLAVERGAETDKSFVEYVEYLANEGYVPPAGRGWVDHIRKKGNEANHEIVIMTREDAVELITFLEMLLKFIYEFPSRIPSAEPTP